MSQSSDSTDPAPPQLAGTTYHEHHRRGGAFGLEYGFGLRVRDLSDAVPEPDRTRHLAHERRLALPTARGDAGDPVADGIGRWESDRGTVA